MSTRMGSRVFGSLALMAVLAVPAGAFAQTKTMSDAQVEANVLKAFAGDQRLANQPINTSTVFGTVTLTGSVSDEPARDAAEQLASRTDGVKKVVDQLTVGPVSQAAQNGANYDPASQNTLPGAAMPSSQGAAAAAQGGNQNGNMAPGGQYDQQQGSYPQQQQGYPQQQQGGYPPQQGAPAYGDPQQGPPRPPQQGRLYYRDYQRQQAMQNGQGAPPPPPQGQPGGQHVVVPENTVLAVTINRWLSSGNAEVGSGFTAVVAQDVLAGGQVAIPRGSIVDGSVIDAKGAGALKGHGELTLQLNTLEIGGQRVPLQVDPFTVNGRDKTARSVTSTVVGAGFGALIGAAIGRGTGAAIGAGVGGAAGLGSAAASGGGQANIRPEELLHFRIVAPTPLTTVSQAEMQRLASYAPQMAPPPPPPGYYRRGYYGY